MEPGAASLARPHEGDRKLVKALSRGISILSAFTPRDIWLGNADLAERVGLPKATVSRITQTLADLEYLRYSRRRRQYRLGAAVLALGYEVLADLDVRKIARPKMQKLADAFNGVVGLAARDGFHLIHIETCHSSTSAVSLRLDSGTQAPIVDTAFGRALLSALPADERESLLSQLQRRYGMDWPKLHRALTRDFDAVRRDGFCAMYGRWQHNINTIGVPLRFPNGEPPLALGFAGFTGQLSRTRLKQEIGAQLVSVARAVEDELAQIVWP